MPRERMSHGFAVFNCHVNNAKERADKEFIAQFGMDQWEHWIKPHHEAGIMSIFEASDHPQRQIWVALCTSYVNEGEKRRSGVVHQKRNRGAKAQ